MAENELGESAARYRAIVENQAELICCFRPDGTLTFVNEACCRYFGKQRQELVGRSFTSLVPQAHREFVEKQYASLSPSHPVVTYEHRVMLPQGGMGWQQWTGQAVFDEQGCLVEVHSVGRDITEHKWMEDALRYRVELERLITAISTHFINLPLAEIDQGLNEALGMVGAFADVDRSYVFLFSPDGAWLDNTHEWCALEIKPQIDTWKGIPVISLPWLVERVRRLESICIPCVADLPPEASAERQMFQAQGTRSVVIVPMVCGRKPIGFVGFDVVREERLRIDRNVVLLRMVSDIFANALERKQVEEALRRRTAQLEALRHVGLELTAQLDLDSLLRSFVSRAVELLGGVSGDFHLYRPEQDVLERYVALDRHPMPAQVTLRRGEGLAGKILETGRPLIVDDYRHWGEQAAAYEVYPVAAIVGVPVQWGNPHALSAGDGASREFLGVLDVWSDKAGAFSLADAELLEMFATQAAVAIKNAWLVHSLQESEEALRRQLKELTVLHAVATAGAEATGEDTLIEHATHVIGETLYSDNFGVLLLDKGDGALHPHPSYRSFEEWKPLTIPLGRGVTGRVAAEGRPGRIPDVSREPAYLKADPRTCSELCVPLKVGERVIGVINAESAHLDAFSEADERLLTILADQLATAIEKLRLFEAERQRRQEAETLRKATTALTSTLDLERVLGSLLLHLEQVIPCDSACVLLLEGEKVRAVAGRGFSVAAQVVGREYPADTALFRDIFHTGRPVILADAQSDDRFQYWDGTTYTRGWLGVPLMVRGHSIGCLALANRKAAAYGEAEATLAQAFANQAAAAIENARLYAEVEKRAKELATALARQEELDRLKSEFIQNVSHELRTPLSIIMGYAELLADGDLGELQSCQREPVVAIARRGRVLKKLVDDFTTIMEVERGKLEREPVDLAELIRALLADSRVNAEQAGVFLSAEFAPDPFLVVGDLAHLRRMSDNLLDNALKFTPPGGTITVRLLRDGANAVLEVADTGIGIPSDKLERIFDRFYQVDGSVNRRYGGMGLGLALVKEVVEAHGGRISVHSTLGKGTTFRATLPALADPERFV